MTGPISIYIHIPFCARKCRYCDFLSGPAPSDVRARYLQDLLLEIRRSEFGADNAGLLAGSAVVGDNPSGCRGADVDTIYIGGGTPSLLSGEEMQQLMDALRAQFRIREDAEISCESNPGTVTAEKLKAYRAAGINRLSIGVQSFDDRELRLLGRIHSREQALTAYEDARAAGFSNINLDLMSALPGQTFDAWMNNLRTAVSLGPEHISAYSLILEDGTVLKEMYERGELPAVPDDDLDRRMYHETKRFLAVHGYHRYEISNYAKEGYECRHNIGYWTRHDYLGFGPGAASLIGHERWTNVRSTVQYMRLVEENNTAVISSLRTEREHLSQHDEMAEFMFLGLRLTEGVSEETFRRTFGQAIEEVYGDVLRTHIRGGLLQRENGRVFLTERGLDICNYVMCDFL